MEGRTGDQFARGRRLLPAGTRARLLPLRKHLRALPSFHTDSIHPGALAAQRVDAHDLAEDAEKPGRIDEAKRHRTLVSRLDALIAQSETA
ncbi:hypothetical protein [Rhodococcus sp. ZPP]|uniref:hypothetical protein n=1 Tax=Rhodococcus sp. ZPP TaxID=2749906 RepID=UPI001FCC3B41|nr:hypothetical protein [Rhodococcus sp. ZPP]